MTDRPGKCELPAYLQQFPDLDELPLPGSGATPARHIALLNLGRTDLSLARIMEAHTDALAILAEAARRPRVGGLYGVWASDAPQGRVRARRNGTDGWLLNGTKLYCSGASFVASALVTAHFEDTVLLFDVDVQQPTVVIEPSNWQSPAFADTSTGPVTFNDTLLEAHRLVGTPDWYLDRTGFWHGAIGPAACWAGGAVFLVDAATRLARRDPHSRAQLGALQSIAWGLRAVLEQSGREIDSDPTDVAGQARVRALKVRQLVERMCTDVLDRFGRATGPQLLAFDAQVARQHAALAVYIRQCHTERDLESIPA